MAFWNPRRTERPARPDGRLLLEAAVALEAAALALRTTSLKRTFRLATRAWRRLERSGDRRDPRAVMAAVARAAHRSPRHYECLHKSLALWWLLRREGYPAEVKLGVSPLDDRLDAHAWVELDGDVILDDDGAVAEFFDLGADMARVFGERPGDRP